MLKAESGLLASDGQFAYGYYQRFAFHGLDRSHRIFVRIASDGSGVCD